MNVETAKKLQELLKYDDKIFGLAAGDLIDISREWAQMSKETRGQTQVLAIRQTLLYQLQAEIAGGIRGVPLAG
jgi:hypothetical protein